MKSVTIYTPGSTKAYYNAFYYLQNKRRLKVTLINSRFFYQLLTKINNHLRIFRLIRRILTGKSNKAKFEPSWKEIFQSLISPIILLFKKNIILGFNPYDNIIYYLIILKFLRKNIIFDTSWAYWDTKKYVKKPILISRFLWKLFLKKTKTFSCNKTALNSLKHYGIKPYYLPHSINTDLFGPKAKKSKEIKVLYVGRLIREKGIKGIIKASEKFPECTFVFVGDGPLKRIINKKNTMHLPFVKNTGLSDIYNSSDIFILNSYSTKKWEEWFGISLIEAMSCGLSCISTNCVGPKEIIKNNKDGILIPQKDQNALEHAIRGLIKNKRLREKIGENARKTALGFDVSYWSRKAENMICEDV
ncbi:MAG: glycosyltransferase [Nanoarchaeota archaeon]|nr:glycosyltransferase [Nanoarchaeota archaeon]